MQMMSNMTKQFGILMDPRQIRSRNIAVVSVTATLPPFALPGQNADVLVSTLGDAKSLQGGVLLQTALKGANGQTYAVAQGPLTLGGFDGGSAGGSSVRRNITTVPGYRTGVLWNRECL
jgi:Flagellar basal-body P-ring protein